MSAPNEATTPKETAETKPAEPCCAPEKKATCCEPEAKSACCGPKGEGKKGCC